MSIRKILLNNIGIKLLTLCLAVITWFYVSEVTKQDSDKTVLQKLLTPATYISKKLYVKPIFVGNLQTGYVFKENEIKTTPEFVVVIGPSAILSKKENIYTMPIDISEYTSARTIDVELERISRPIRFQKAKVQVYLPIFKAEEEK
ncbi:MAG: hypothetical protein JW994_07535 [Candidatus Omnitrophica bacterium]|nr:hypothetical protein [Candidatus Omnitrophota bacterium]